jgi:hypothetical protein
MYSGVQLCEKWKDSQYRVKQLFHECILPKKETSVISLSHSRLKLRLLQYDELYNWKRHVSLVGIPNDFQTEADKSKSSLG